MSRYPFVWETLQYLLSDMKHQYIKNRAIRILSTTCCFEQILLFSMERRVLFEGFAGGAREWQREKYLWYRLCQRYRLIAARWLFRVNYDHFEVMCIFWGSWGSSKKCLKLNQTCIIMLRLSKTLRITVGTVRIR